ncbi:1-phosphatidylinositol 3-phosphate 5-kinase-like [Schistocerca gregaria]|uniref:1-phosphatidylinositol 3-phosphate 5-kinase-like n=1 Tax=Schistocerca gregaria TaxID=7010 RepID=UPI00211EA26B|nr:1-phosphatidylinositol 3-phosphate 5-kinase-like [Schistocerca gregaria]
MNDALPAVKFDYDFLLAQNRPCDLCTEPCLPETKSIRVPASELPFIDFLTYLKNKRPNVAKFAPQHLTYLYSLYNQSSNTQCVQHEFQVIHYYTSNDMTLGNFLLDVCFSARIRCSRETCHRAIEDHEQCFMHNRDRVNVVVRASDASDIELISNATAVHPLSSKSQARIHTWSKCKRSVVQGEPTAVLMSRESSSFSFGKFLELLFYCSNAYCLRCGQHVYKDHVHYFSYADRVAAFEHESVDIFEVVVPPILLKYDLEPLREVAHRDLLEIFDLSENIHVHILQKLEGLRDICRNAGGEEEQQKITATIQERVEAYADTRQRLRAAMLDGRNTRLFETSKIRRSVCLDSVNWNDVILKLEAEVQKILNFSKGSKLNASSALPSGEAALSKGRKGSGEKAENFTDALEQRSDSQVIDSLTNGGSCGGGEPKRRVSVSGGAEATEVSSGDNTEELKGMEVEGTGEGWQSEKAASFDSYLTERCRKSGCQLRGSKEDTSQGDVLNSDGPPVSLSHPFAPLSEVSSNLAHGLNLNMTTPDSSCKNGASGFTTVPLQKAMQRFLELKKSSILELVKGGPALILSSNVNSEYCVPIYEGEPSSLIAFFLTSEQYDLKTKEFLAAPRDVSFHRYHCEHSFRGNGDLDQLEDTVGDSEAALAALDESDSLYSRIIYGLVSPNPTTVNLEWQSPQIWGGPEVYIQCKAYFAQQFSWLRWLLGIPHDIFAQSLLRCRPWKPIGGKSNSEFIKTMDGRFILKQVQSVELESFLASALIYFDYFLKAVLQQIPTALCKVVGVYSVAWSTREGKALKKADFIMQEDLFFGHSVEKVFDLKGSQRSRYAKIGNDSKATKCVLLDENFLEAMYKQPICIGSKGKTLLSKAIWNDSQRLSSLNVMDYSLLVGFDNTNKKLILGIIDYMRTYTWDKQLETWVKRSGILGGSGSKVPTIISPKEYKKRFQDAIWTYFLFMPTSSTKLVYKKFL